jgi:proteasome assembly chaperone (PAC2) family protein
MDYISVYETPVLRTPPLVAAFAGWPDAAESATGALRYLVRKLPAKKFAELDPEEFYDFTSVRPYIFTGEGGQRFVRWPSNELFYWKGEDTPYDLVLFIGIEPSLRWKTFASTLIGFAERCKVRMVVTVGALLDAIPHSREPRISGSANRPELRRMLEEQGIYFSGYQGPTGIHSALMEACSQRGLPYASIWGHAPHYLHISPNPKVSYALLRKLNRFLGFHFDLSELRSAIVAFEDEVGKAVAKDPGISSYIQRLEQHYDEAVRAQEELPSPEAVVKDLEEFLRQQRQEGEEPPF